MSNFQIIDQSQSVIPTVSVAMLTYNHGKFIAEAIESVLMQKTSFAVKIIIAEDCSTDDTREIIIKYQKLYPEKIKLILQNENVGAHNNNIDLFRNLKGKYIAALEGDDYWTDPLKLQKQVDFLESNKDYGLVFTGYKILNEKLNTNAVHLMKRDYEDENINYLFNADMRTLTVMFDATRFLKDILELLNMDFMKNAIIGDRPIFLLIASKSKIKYFKDYTGVYRISNNDSGSHFNELSKYYSFYCKSVQLNLKLIEYLKIYDLKYKTYLIEREIFFKTFLLLFEKNYSEFARLFFKRKWKVVELRELFSVIKKSTNAN